MLAVEIPTDDGQRQRGAEGKGGGGDAAGGSWTRFSLRYSSAPAASCFVASIVLFPLACTLCPRSGRSTCSRQRRSCTSTRRYSTQVSPPSSTASVARSRSQPCPSAHEPGRSSWRACGASSRWRPRYNIPVPVKFARCYTTRCRRRRWRAPGRRATVTSTGPPGLRFGLPDHQTKGWSSTGLANLVRVV